MTVYKILWKNPSADHSTRTQYHMQVGCPLPIYPTWQGSLMGRQLLRGSHTVEGYHEETILALAFS